jgi:type IV pilus assembly protein PilB
VPAIPPDADLLDMDQAIVLLKTTRPTFYRWLRGGKLAGMKVGRQWRFDRSEVERFLRGEPPRIELRADIEPLLDALRDRLKGLGETDPFPAEMPPLERAVMLMLLMMPRMGATDMHIEPRPTSQRSTEALLRCRVDGVLHEITPVDGRLLGPLLDQWKRTGTLDVREKDKPQYAVLAMRLPGMADSGIFRLTFLPALLGESLTVRMTGTSPYVGPMMSIDALGLAPADRERLAKALRSPWGLILVTGPAGTGKTTTLYSCLGHLSSPKVKIVTIEDPVRAILPEATQMQVRADAGATHAELLRAALLSSPNMVLLSELLDTEMLNLLLRGALTGHLMFSTLHCNDAAAALHRLIDMGGDAQVVADVIRLVIAQRLVRTLCRHCSQPDPEPLFLERGMMLARSGGLDWDSLPKAFRRPVGCAKCNHVGYAGQVMVAETLEIREEVAALLRHGAAPADIRAAAVRNGMTTYAADAVRKAAEGLTGLEEVMRVIEVGQV